MIDIERIMDKACDDHVRLIESVRAHKRNTQELIRILLDVFENKNKVFFCGNGGSSADCHHFAGEFLGRYNKNRQSLPAINLSSDSATITCIANDYSFDNIFDRQLEALGNEGDALIAFTTSGKSQNVINALKIAKIKKMKTISFCGDFTDYLSVYSDLLISFETHETARIQEAYYFTLHCICEIIDEHFE